MLSNREKKMDEKLASEGIVLAMIKQKRSNTQSERPVAVHKIEKGKMSKDKSTRAKEPI